MRLLRESTLLEWRALANFCETRVTQRQTGSSLRRRSARTGGGHIWKLLLSSERGVRS
jgi:hypothetical protein